MGFGSSLEFLKVCVVKAYLTVVTDAGSDRQEREAAPADMLESFERWRLSECLVTFGFYLQFCHCIAERAIQHLAFLDVGVGVGLPLVIT